MPPKQPTKRPKPTPARIPDSEEEEDSTDGSEARPNWLHELEDLPDDSLVNRDVANARRIAMALQRSQNEITAIDDAIARFNSFLARSAKVFGKASAEDQAKISAVANQRKLQNDASRDRRRTLVELVGEYEQELVRANKDLEQTLVQYEVNRARREPSASFTGTPKRTLTATKDSLSPPTPPRRSKRTKGQKGSDFDDESPTKPTTSATSGERYGRFGESPEWTGVTSGFRGVSNPLVPTPREPTTYSRGVSGGGAVAPSATPRNAAIVESRQTTTQRLRFPMGGVEPVRGRGPLIRRESLVPVSPLRTPTTTSKKTSWQDDHISENGRDAAQNCEACVKRGLRCYYEPPTKAARKARCGRCANSHIVCQGGKSAYFESLS